MSLCRVHLLNTTLANKFLLVRNCFMLSLRSVWPFFLKHIFFIYIWIKSSCLIHLLCISSGCTHLYSLSFFIRSPNNDAEPAAELPEYDGCAAAPKPWSAQFPEGRHGWTNGGTNAEHNGPVPTDAIISGTGSACNLSKCDWV